MNIELATPDIPELSAFAGPVTKVRVTARTESGTDDTLIDLPSGTLSFSLRAFPAERARFEVEAFDALGRVRAYGRTDLVELRDGLEIPLRRNLAYTVHQAGSGDDRPEAIVYAIDVVDRTLVERLRIPGEGVRARSVTAWGGRAMLFAAALPVRAAEDPPGMVAVLSTADHRFDVVMLEHPPDVVLAPDHGSVGVAVGGGLLSFVDFETLEVLGVPVSLGGTALDAGIAPDGRRALVAVDISPPGLIDVDLRRMEVIGSSVTPAPAGIAVDRRAGQAYVVSSEVDSVVAVDLPSGRASSFSRDLVSAGGLAVYSDVMGGLVTVSEDGPGSTLVGFSTFFGQPVPGSVVSFDGVTGLAMDGAGRHGVLVATGGPEGEPGWTVFDARFNELPEATSLAYVEDPVERVRYLPRGVGIVYGD